MCLHSRIKQLAKSNRVSIRSIEKHFGYAEKLIKTWKTREPSAYKIKEIAQYLHTSTDYLLGLTDIPIPYCTTRKLPERKLKLLLTLFETDLSDKQLDIISEYVEELRTFSNKS